MSDHPLMMHLEKVRVLDDGHAWRRVFDGAVVKFDPSEGKVRMVKSFQHSTLIAKHELEFAREPEKLLHYHDNHSKNVITKAMIDFIHKE